MTLPVSGPISLSQIANEVGLSLPISINHPWLLNLINKSGLPVSFSDFYGKTGRCDGNLLGQGGGGSPTFINFSSSPFFGGTLVSLLVDSTPETLLNVGAVPNWTGNIKAINNTTGVSIVLSPYSATYWRSGSAPANLIRSGVTDSFTILPSN